MKPRVAILGAGPAGLGAAWKLTELSEGEIVLFEKSDRVGGLAGSFSASGVTVDFGAHRLHAGAEPEVLDRLKALLGPSLRERPRRGAIRLQGRWLNFPLQFADLLLKFPPGLALRCLLDYSLGFLSGHPVSHADYEGFVRGKFGHTFYELFYRPFAVKVWGLPPDQMSADQARRRIRTQSLVALARKVILGAIKTSRADGSIYYYPRKGYGQICDDIHREILTRGVEVKLRAGVRALQREGDGFLVEFDEGGRAGRISADCIISTIPLTLLVNLFDPPPGFEVVEASRSLRYRSIILVYLIVGRPRVGDRDAYYFPEEQFIFNRVSEQKNFSEEMVPEDRTVLCCDISCNRGDGTWLSQDSGLVERAISDLEKVGLLAPSEVSDYFVRRIEFAYPIYDLTYRDALDTLVRYCHSIPNLVTIGRQGLFLHNNTHHSLLMGFRAAEYLVRGGAGGRSWDDNIAEFDTFQVID